MCSEWTATSFRIPAPGLKNAADRIKVTQGATFDSRSPIGYLNPHVEEVNAIAFDNPALFRYPIAYVIEPDWWSMTDSEAVAIAPTCRRAASSSSTTSSRCGGGFQDGARRDRLAGPTAAAGVSSRAHEAGHARGALLRPGRAHPIFHAFFEIDGLDVVPQAFSIGGRPVFRGLFEDNDPTKRLQMVVNYNTDVSQFWEWSGPGLGRSTRRTRRTRSASTTSSTA